MAHHGRARRATHWIGSAIRTRGTAILAGATMALAVVVVLAGLVSTGLVRLRVTYEMRISRPWVPLGLTHDGSPLHWRCDLATIGFVENLDHSADLNFIADVRAAFAQASAASGLRFVDRGISTRDAASWLAGPRPPDQQVLVSWASSPTAMHPGLDRDAVGIALPVPAGPNRAFYDHGLIELAGWRRDIPGSRAAASWYTTLLHEAAHVSGLGHVDDPAEAMDPTTNAVWGYGVGDRAGLAALGAAACGNPALAATLATPTPVTAEHSVAPPQSVGDSFSARGAR